MSIESVLWNKRASRYRAATKESDGKCPDCGIGKKEKPHACPYQEDVNDNPDNKYCTCCSACESDCRDDI